MTDDRLNKLYPSSANVRKTGAKDGIEGLAQSIHNHGLLNNLAVQPGGEKETFSVLAGGRRLAALNHLAKAKLIPADWGVPRNVTEIEIEGDIPSGEISLAENEMRAAMRKAQRHEERQHGEGSRTVAEREGVATGSAAGRKVSQPVEPIPCKIDPVSSREVIAGRTVIAYVHGDLAGQEYANAAVIVRAVTHDHLVAALKAISTHWANQYDHPNMEAPMYQGQGHTGPASQTATERLRL